VLKDLKGNLKMYGKLNKINECLLKADIVLYKIDEQSGNSGSPPPVDIWAPPPSGYEDSNGNPIIIPDQVDPGGVGTHGMHNPWWLMPPAKGIDMSTHPLWDVYTTFANYYSSTFIDVFWLLPFDQFLSALRFIYRPHIPNSVFNRIPGLRGLLRMLGIEDVGMQNYLRDLLRSWMLNNLDMNAEMLQHFFPHLFKPLLPNDVVMPPGTRSVPQPPEPWTWPEPRNPDTVTPGSTIRGSSDRVLPIGSAYIGPYTPGEPGEGVRNYYEQTSPLERIKQRHRIEHEKLTLKQEREIEIAQGRERNRSKQAANR
jgi:hypothetical protein